MTHSPDLVSIVIPCYKGSRFLAETIESCLKQTYREIEVIVVDDASPLNDAEIADGCAARDSRVRVVRREKNGGVSRAYNSGYAVAQGDYYTRLSQDDLFREDAVEIMLGACRLRRRTWDWSIATCRKSTKAAAGSPVNGNQAAPRETASSPDNALFPTQEVGLCVMWRRSVYEASAPSGRATTSPRTTTFTCGSRGSTAWPSVADEAPFFFRCHSSNNGTVSQMQQSAAYSLAQMSHAWATIKRHPARWRCWKGIVGCGLRIGVLKAKTRLLRKQPPSGARLDGTGEASQ